MSKSSSPSPKTSTSKFAIASFVFGVLGLFTGALAIPSIFCGHAALRKVKNSPHHIKGKGLAQAGLSLAYATILILLLGFTAIYTSQHMHRKRMFYAESQNMALQLKSAISAYCIEYQKYPITSKKNGYAELRSKPELMDCLWALEEYPFKEQLNSKGIVFFSGKKATVSHDGKYHSGSHFSAEGHADLFDAWGNYFYVRIDLKGAKPVHKPFLVPQDRPHSIRVWSAGKDGISGTGDDIKSW